MHFAAQVTAGTLLGRAERGLGSVLRGRPRGRSFSQGRETRRGRLRHTASRSSVALLFGASCSRHGHLEYAARWPGLTGARPAHCHPRKPPLWAAECSPPNSKPLICACLPGTAMVTTGQAGPAAGPVSAPADRSPGAAGRWSRLSGLGPAGRPPLSGCSRRRHMSPPRAGWRPPPRARMQPVSGCLSWTDGAGGLVVLAAADSGVGGAGPCVTPDPDPTGDSPLPAHTPATVAARSRVQPEWCGRGGEQDGRGLLAAGRGLG